MRRSPTGCPRRRSAQGSGSRAAALTRSSRPSLHADTSAARAPSRSGSRSACRSSSSGSASPTASSCGPWRAGVLERLVAAWHETALLAIATEVEVVYIDKVVSDRFGFRTDPRVSARRPLHSHSLGKALLAASGDELVEELIDVRGLEAVTEFTIVEAGELLDDLRDTRERGFAMDQQEAVLGVCCVGAPVRDHTGRLAAAISLSTIREYYRPEVTGPAVRDGAFQISRAMGWNGELEDLYTAVPGGSSLLGDVSTRGAATLARA